MLAFFADDGSSELNNIVSALSTAPLPVYFTDSRGAPSELLKRADGEREEWCKHLVVIVVGC